MNNRSGVMNSYHLARVLKASARKLGELRGADAVNMLSRRLAEYIGSPEDDKYSYIWRSAIEDHEQDAYRDDSRAVLVDAVRDAALGATTAKIPEALSVAMMLLQSPYPTLTRVGIFVCGEHYGILGSVFWQCAKENWFIDISYWHEIYWLIKNTFTRFSVAEREQFLQIVEQLKGEWSDRLRQQEWDETHRRDLLHPAFGLGDSTVDSRYIALVQRWGPVREHPDFHTYSTSGSAGDRSPVTSDALISMSDEELVAFLKAFEPDDRGWDGPTYRGVASSISAAVRGSPDGFVQRIGLFANLARPYQHGLLRGLKERWTDDKRNIDWPATLSLLRSIVSSPAFGIDLASDQPKGWEPSVHWVVSDIADLIKVSSDKERHLPAELNPLCLNILCLVLDAMVPNEAGKSDDAVSRAINSPRGRTIESLIHLALAMRREEIAAKTGSNDTWGYVGSVLEAELATSELGLNADFAAMAGMYCVNLHYLNAEWTEANFDRFFSSINEAAWNCAAQGFAYQRYLYDWLFNSLVRSGHLRKMVFSESLPDQVTEKALQFLGFAYLEDMESLNEEGLLSELIAGLNVKALTQLCWFFWTLRGETRPYKHTTKILTFWMKVAEQIRANKANLPELLSALSKLAVFLYELTPTTMAALVEAAPHAEITHHGYILVENLTRLANSYPKEVATIFRAALSGFLPVYDKEDVIKLVSQLANAGEADEAEWICNEYAKRDSTLLKDYYEVLRARQRAQKDSGSTSA